jgi:hypothetical protein
LTRRKGEGQKPSFRRKGEDMPEPSFLGIAKQQWELINSFSSWASAFGSLVAASVALHLANRAPRPSARVSVGRRLAVAGEKVTPIGYVCFSIVNVGYQPIRVTSIGWRTGIFRKRYMMQGFEPSVSDALPVVLSHGQEARWMTPVIRREDSWDRLFAGNFLLGGYRGPFRKFHALASCATLRATFRISVGVVFYAIPEPNLMKRLRRACEAGLGKRPLGRVRDAAGRKAP